MAATEHFHTVGRRLLNQIFNGSTSKPATLYLGLRQLDGVSGHPSDATDADTLTSNLQEVSTSGTGYARIAVTFNNTNMPETLSGANSILTFAVQQFNFTGTVTGITHAFIASTSDNTGVLIASAPMSVTRNVANGDQINETFTFTMSG